MPTRSCALAFAEIEQQCPSWVNGIRDSLGATEWTAKYDFWRNKASMGWLVNAVLPPLPLLGHSSTVSFAEVKSRHEQPRKGCG